MCSHESVQTALGLFKTCPTTRPLTFVISYGPGAGLASDAAKTPLDKRIVRDLVLTHVGPDFLPRPVSKRIDLHDPLVPERIRSVKLQPLDCLPASALIPAQTRDPGVQGRQPLLEREHLTQRATGVRLAFP